MYLRSRREVTSAALIAVLSASSLRAAAQEVAPEPPPVTAPAPVPAPAPVARAIPSPAEVAWSELHALQEQERTLWEERKDSSIGLPVTGIALGIPMLSVLLPIGAMLIADSHDTFCDGSSSGEEDCTSDHHERAVGRSLVAFGVIGAVMLGVGAWGVARVRNRRRNFEGKLESIGQRRTLLEHVLEAQMRGASISY